MFIDICNSLKIQWIVICQGDMTQCCLSQMSDPLYMYTHMYMNMYIVCEHTSKEIKKCCFAGCSSQLHRLILGILFLWATKNRANLMCRPQVNHTMYARSLIQYTAINGKICADFNDRENTNKANQIRESMHRSHVSTSAKQWGTLSL